MPTLPVTTTLQTPRLPGRINAEQAAMLLGFQKHDIPVLVSAKLLRPLGNPCPSAPKWFASVVVEVLRQDSEFLAKATRVVSKNWHEKNARKSKVQNDTSRLRGQLEPHLP